MNEEDLRGFLAGWFAGCAGIVASHPLDTVRVRMQMHNYGSSTTFQSLRNIVREEKVSGLFKGITYPLLGRGLISASVFGVQSIVYRRLSSGEDQCLSVWKSAVAGCASGAVQTLIVCPVELVKIRMQNQGIGKHHVSWIQARVMGSHITTPRDRLLQQYRGPLQTTRDILHTEGIRGIYKGFWLTLYREVPQCGIYFGTYAWLRLKLSSLTGTPHQELGVVPLALAGGVTGVVTWLWYPVDVIKSRFQNDRELRYSGVVDCIRQSLRSEGVKVLVKGLEPTLVRGFVHGIATLPIYTLLMRLLHSSNE